MAGLSAVDAEGVHLEDEIVLLRHDRARLRRRIRFNYSRPLDNKHNGSNKNLVLVQVRY